MVSLSTQRRKHREREKWVAIPLARTFCYFLAVFVSAAFQFHWPSHNPPQNNNKNNQILSFGTKQSEQKSAVDINMQQLIHRSHNWLSDWLCGCVRNSGAISIRFALYGFFVVWKHNNRSKCALSTHSTHTLARVPHSPSWRIESELGPGIVRSVSL